MIKQEFAFFNIAILFILMIRMTTKGKTNVKVSHSLVVEHCKKYP